MSGIPGSDAVSEGHIEMALCLYVFFGRPDTSFIIFYPLSLRGLGENLIRCVARSGGSERRSPRSTGKGFAAKARDVNVRKRC